MGYNQRGLGRVKLRIREVRLKSRRKVSMCQLAREIGVSASEFSKYENHKTVPSLDTVVRIADALKVKVDKLIERETA